MNGDAPMTYEQRLERAARRLCALRGVDPDAAIPALLPSVIRPRWKAEAVDLEYMMKIVNTIKEFDL